MRRNLILYVPVIHKGYLDFFERHRDDIENIYLLPDFYAEEFSTLKPDIASLPVERISTLLKDLGYSGIRIFDKSQVLELQKKPLLLINDRISRALAQSLFTSHADLRWDSVFLRWDTDSVYAEEDPAIPQSSDKMDVIMMHKAQLEAQKSSDWWRQVGAVVVGDGKIIDAAFNEAMPNDHTPYQRGAVRDFLKPGERPELADTIHAEQKIIATAAKNGRSLSGATLYITHFPCPVCAKLIAHSGITRCCFLQGSSSLRGGEILKSAGVDLVRVVL